MLSSPIRGKRARFYLKSPQVNSVPLISDQYTSVSFNYALRITSPCFALTIQFMIQAGSCNPHFGTTLHWERGTVETILEQVPSLSLWDRSWFFYRETCYDENGQGIDGFVSLLSSANYAFSNLDDNKPGKPEPIEVIDPFGDVMEEFDGAFRKEIDQLIASSSIQLQPLCKLVVDYLGFVCVQFSL